MRSLLRRQVLRTTQPNDFAAWVAEQVRDPALAERLALQSPFDFEDVAGRPSQALANLHIKDRRRDHGDRVMLGAGDTPIRDCATLILDNRWHILLIVEREYRNAPGNPLEQTRWELNYLRGILETAE